MKKITSLADDAQEETNLPLLSAGLTKRKIRKVGVPPWKENRLPLLIHVTWSGFGGRGGEEGEEEVLEAERMGEEELLKAEGTRRPRGTGEAEASAAAARRSGPGREGGDIFIGESQSNLAAKIGRASCRERVSQLV